LQGRAVIPPDLNKAVHLALVPGKEIRLAQSGRQLTMLVSLSPPPVQSLNGCLPATLVVLQQLEIVWAIFLRVVADSGPGLSVTRCLLDLLFHLDQIELMLDHMVKLFD
jgi:hypothetical protein